MTKRLLVRGRVQGVGYRVSMVYAAHRYGVNGWVRNRRDGAVESIAQGPESSVQAFIDWAHNGPDLAEVESVEVLEAEGAFSGFEIADTI